MSGGGPIEPSRRPRGVGAPPVERHMRARRASGRPTPTFALLGGLVLVLNLVGLVMVLSASSVESQDQFGHPWYYVTRQSVWAAAGFIVLLFVQRIDYHRYRRWAGLGLVGSIGMLVAVLVPGLGVQANGSTRWLGYGPLQIQPSELAKLAVLLFCADLLARRAHLIERSDATLRPVLVVLTVVSALIMLQPNLGTTMVIGAIVVALLYVAGVPRRRLALLGASAVSLVTVAAWFAPYRKARLLAYLDPYADPLGNGYQTIQAWAAISEGHLTGVGVGAGRAKWGFLPFAHTDFIFAVVGEEFGLVGAALLLAVFAALALAGVHTARGAPDMLGTLLAAGITCWFFVQAFVNVGAVVGILPITGVPLPFVSAGGSSLLASMAAAGVLLNVARQAR